MNVTARVMTNGRIVIPKPMCEKLNITESQKMEITLIEETGQIVMRKIEPCCAICGSPRNLTEISGGHLCQNCIKRVKEL